MLAALKIESILRRACLFVCIVVAGCQSSSGIVEQLDARSGLTIVTGREPVVFARTVSRLSRSARDYVYLGPVEVNERGTREYFLWVAMASTIDRGDQPAEESMPDFLYLDLAGEPIEFELKAWDERVSQLAGRETYDPAVAPVRILAARVTLNQLHLISQVRPQSVRVAAREQPTIEYILWSDDSRWTAFSNYSGL